MQLIKIPILRLTCIEVYVCSNSIHIKRQINGSPLVAVYLESKRALSSKRMLSPSPIMFLIRHSCISGCEYALQSNLCLQALQV
jgi:hypothetical protein